jgi:DNA mismatch repair protein MutL
LGVEVRIKVLPDTVINQIAAGEVVERPASVVRELVDNSIDAGSTDIFVALEGGGHSRLKVRDNGVGMTRDEAVLAFERHATSKVSKIDDLNTLETLGFRGEALASIAAVSKITLKTRSQDSDVGASVVFRGGRLIDAQSTAWSRGTEIEVEHLFFNTPARRKFLKSPRSEVARIRSWLANSALGRPGVRYRLISDGDEVLHLNPVATTKERARDVFSADLIPVSISEGGVRVEGMVGHPGQAIGDSSGFVVLINSRLVSDRIVMKGVREGYESMLKDREYPVGYLSIELSSEQVDVNVHPQKSEVRFRHPEQIFSVVKGGVLAAVRAIRSPSDLAQRVPRESVNSPLQAANLDLSQYPASDDSILHTTKPAAVVQESIFSFGASQRSKGPAFDSLSVGDHVSDRYSNLESSYREVSQTNNLEPSEPRQSVERYYSRLRFLGQALGCYLLCELDDRLVVVDMHAAHERINYNRIRAAFAKREVITQTLLIPNDIRLTEEQVVRLVEEGEILSELGFIIDEVAADTVRVRGVPAVLAEGDFVGLIRECAAELLVSGWRERLEERIDLIVARIACHASVRSGDRLNSDDVYSLFEQMDRAESAGACPHGRPVVAEFSRDMVERWFGRDR